MQTRTFCLAAALLSVAPAAIAQAPAAPTAPDSQTYVLRYKFKQGDVNYYKMTTDMNSTIGGGPTGKPFLRKQHLYLVYHQTVTGVNAADGAATLVTKFDDLNLTIDGQHLPNADTMEDKVKGGTVITTISPTGEPSTVKVDGLDGVVVPGIDFSKLVTFQGASPLPEIPIKIG